MKDSIITDSGRAYLMGIMTMALSMFLGYKWSPDYVEFVSNGYNFLNTLELQIINFVLGLNAGVCIGAIMIGLITKFTKRGDK